MDPATQMLLVAILVVLVAVLSPVGGRMIGAFSAIGQRLVGRNGLIPTTGWIWQKSHEPPHLSQAACDLVEGFAAIGRVGISVNQSEDPTGLFLIDERCPGCLGTGRLRVNILEDDIDEERMWRELEIAAHKKWDWEIAHTCTGCGLPFLCGKDANMRRDFCETECRLAYHERGDRTLGTEALNG